ncbi:MAG: Cna B-type protein, partial [Acidobacteria bacterium]|nr:Cna B-type protein [Acidobacteriota bacterium]
RMDLNGGSNNEFTPTIDSVSEFKLQTGALSSQYGNTQTAMTNFGMKSGTNAYHGGAFWFNNQPAYNANSWSNNARGISRSGSMENNYGWTVGGPIWKDHTFFFFSQEYERQTTELYQATNGTLPLQAFKNGDFSQLLNPAFTQDTKSGSVVGTDALGRPIIYGQIYDPATSRQLPDGTWIRDPFEGNIIPTSRFSRVTDIILKNYDVPAPQFSDFRRNQPYISGCCPNLNIDNISLKIDQVITNKHKLSGTFVDNDRSRRRYGDGQTPYIPGPIPQSPMAATKLQATPGKIFRFAEDWTISPTVINHFAYGYNRFVNNNQSYSYLQGQDWATLLGMENVGSNAFPVINWSGFGTYALGNGLYPRMGGVGGAGFGVNGSNIMSDDLTWIKGSHSFRFGWEGRWYYYNSGDQQNTGTYAFSNENVALPGYRTSTGFTYAAFLLGEVQSAGLGIPVVTTGTRSRVYGMYFQDDWKLRSNLTINMGMRWDIPTALTEVRQRQSGFDPTLANPKADGYLGALTLLGTCAGCNGKGRFADPYYKQFSPRIGFAWTPEKTNNKMVIRAGYGINYSPPIQDGWYYSYGTGFNGSNPIEAYSNSRFTEDASYNWDNPYKPYTATLPNTNPSQLNGSNIPWYGTHLTKYPMVQNWNFGIQYEMPWQLKVEANYVGNRGTRLNEPQYINYRNQVPSQNLSLGDTLLDNISAHPEIEKPYPSFTGTVAMSLQPFPQYRSVRSHRTNGGFSTYNAFQLTVTKRSTYGLSFLAAYTFSKALATTDSSGPGNYYDYTQDWYNRKSDYSPTMYNYPQDLKITWIYDLPFGSQGRWLKSGPLSYIAGGWTVSMIQRYVTGPPIRITTGTPTTQALYNPGFRPDVLLPRDQQTLATPTTVIVNQGVPYLNPAAFSDLPKTSRGVPLRMGTAPRLMPDLRGWADYGEDFSLIKRTPIKVTESAYFEMRMDAINLLNRINLCNPNTNAGAPADFGKVFGKCGGPRTIQLGIRLSF